MPSGLTEVFRAHPIHLHSKHPDFTALREVPDSYTWTQPDDYCPSGDSLTNESVPVIDLHHPNATYLIGHACRTWGVFQITNHGIPSIILEDIERTSRSLFSLPVQEKLKAARSPEGVSGYGLVRISSFFSKLMWSEGFTISGSPIEHFRHLWPKDYSKHCGIIEGYEEEMKKLAAKLMWSMLGSLGITKEDITWAGPEGDFKDACPVLQLNNYPACPDPDRAMGLAAHTDSTFLTIIYQDNTSGLQVLKEGAGWVKVPPIPGALVVNVGDLFHVLSNGQYQSVLHRALVNRTRSRLSIAFFFGPPDSAQLSPLPKLLSPMHPPLYRPVTWSEYLGTKAKHFNNALSMIRVSGFVGANNHDTLEKN